MSEVITYGRFWQRRDTAANWIAVNPILHSGEFGVETDTGGKKLGDGVTAWTALPYDTSPFFAVASGTNTLTATFVPKPVLRDGLELRVRAAAANTAAVTFNPNGLGALSITKQGGTALAVGDIAAAGHELILRYRASPARYELLNPAASGGGSSNGGILIQGGSIDLAAALPVNFAVNGIAAAGYALTGWELWVSPIGSLTLDIRKDVFANIPPTGGDSIVASAPPTITAGTINSSGALTGWTTTINRSDALSVVVTANTGVKWFSLLLKGTRT